ncbi:Peptide chain release factor 1 [Candidatus Cyrtobacter comes]|uniref:Peptide chain release factor 1 n=1 Tax=Candidatus Cyrtobacter comes TaxID=675776 RepID=A0ABU5L8Y4_9RICK|nr:peptide chain release factor 1 [Candidatus Cyrtobacter comes]MDZ5762581.1 Peptide chain release factor 1 [Candidatus Cyrtobacter comes]
MIDKLDKIIENFNNIEARLLSGCINVNERAELGKSRSDLEGLVEVALRYKKMLSDKDDLLMVLQDKEQDDDFKNLVQEELYGLDAKIEEAVYNLKLLMLPKDKDAHKNVILEIRAGTGGEEAALFASVLFRMYMKLAERQRWKFEIISISETGIGGYKEASASISGNGVFSKMKYESGVHRVQRVPETESSGRIHTSAATVAVLPEPEEVDVKIEEKDLRIDSFRASGAGGQHVNKTDSAVRITHKPSGIVVSQQDSKSQHKNKAMAMKILRSKLYEMQSQKNEDERSSMRRSQVGSGDRSERIRTYNYPQSRITDHRVNFTLHSIMEVTQEGSLEQLIEKLIQDEQVRLLSESE